MGVMSRMDYYPLGEHRTKKDDEGYICLNCGKRITNKRRYRYCSDACDQEFFRKNNHSQLRKWLIEKRGRKCEKCGISIEHDYEIIADHIVPVALGGTHLGDESNIQLLCFSCHKEKTANDMKQISRERKTRNNRRLSDYL